MRKPRTIALLLCVIFAVNCFSQIDKLESKFHYGFLIAHRAHMRHLVKGHTKALTLNFEKTVKTGPLADNYNSPGYGFAFYAVDPGNKREIGYGAGIYPYLNLHFVKTPKVWWDTQLGMGLGVVQNTFMRESNFKNIAVGSHLNLLVGVQTDVSFWLNNSLELNTGLSFHHFSNGAIQMPNLGLNLPTYNLGLTYKMNNVPSDVSKPSETNSTDWPGLMVFALAGTREVVPLSGKQFPAFNISSEYMKPLNEKVGFGGGVDLLYKTSLKERIRIDTAANHTVSNFQAGVMGYYHQYFHPLDVYLGIGFYVFDNFKKDKFAYHRLGVRYKTKSPWLFNFNIFTHYAKADHFQFGIGYAIK